MKISEQEYKSFFKNIKFRNVTIPSTGEVCQMPLIAEKAIQMVALFPASRSKVIKKILPIPDFIPVDLGGDQTLLGFIGIEYIKRNIPNYNEILVVVPIFIGKGIKPPTVEDLLKEELGGATLFIRHIAVTTRLAEVLGNELLGYAKFIADIQFLDTPRERICVVSEGGEEIFKFGINSKVEQYGDYERNTLSVTTYKYGKIYKLTYQSQTRLGVNVPPEGWVTFGPHPLGKILSDLDVSQKPILTMYSPYFQLISDETKLEVFEPESLKSVTVSHSKSR